MKPELKQLLQTAIQVSGLLKKSAAKNTTIEVSRATTPDHGDFSSNIALKLSRELNLAPTEIANTIVKTIKSPVWLKQIEVAPPGFINFFVDDRTKSDLLASILEQKNAYGALPPGSQESILLEFVSSNPTGPLHVGHGRHAAYGDSLANILRKAGHTVVSEYYINDSGRQVDILALSVVVGLINKTTPLLKTPQACYQGPYIKKLLATIPEKTAKEINKLAISDLKVVEKDKDKQADALVSIIKNSIGESVFEQLAETVVENMLNIIKSDLEGFGVVFDRWVSEKAMIKDSKINNALDSLNTKKALFEKDGATWLKTTVHGDDKDRVVLRDDGRSTYFASDIAYHTDKKERGFELLINILGSDHHGYIKRLKSGLASMGFNPKDLEVILMQFVTLYRGKKKIQMSTRSGDFVPMRDLYEEVGVDAARFFYVSRSFDQHLDFDLELAKEESNKNPVYYIQYANARISSVLGEIQNKGYKNNLSLGLEFVGSLKSNHESELISMLQNYPEIIKKSAEQRSVHKLCNYLKEIAQIFHSYYGSQKFILKDDQMRNARVVLLLCVSIVVQDGLKLLGVSSPSKM